MIPPITMDPAQSTHDLQEKAIPLTQREKEVLALVLGGRFDKEIAAELGISIRTVEKHVERLRVKFGVRSRRDLPQSSELTGAVTMRNT